MGSRIQVKTVVGQGTTFWFDMQLSVVDPSLAQASPESYSQTEMSPATEDMLMPEALTALPAEWLETLKQGARRADFILLSSVIAQIRAQDARLAGVLAQLAEDFEYDEILALIQAEETTEES